MLKDCSYRRHFRIHVSAPVAFGLAVFDDAQPAAAVVPIFAPLLDWAAMTYGPAILRVFVLWAKALDAKLRNVSSVQPRDHGGRFAQTANAKV